MYAEYTDFLNRLENSVRGATGPVVIAGDFNAHSTMWGSPKEDAERRLVAESMCFLGMLLCNWDEKPTFIRDASESHIDLIFASKELAGHIEDWRVLDEKSDSYHQYVKFRIQRTMDRGAQVDGHLGWAVRKIDYSKFNAALENDFPISLEDSVVQAKKIAGDLIVWLGKLADSCMPRNRGETRRKPVHWWSDSIAELRKECFKKRRIFLKTRKKHSVEASEAVRESYRDSRKELTGAINRAKEKYWSELCSTIDQDPWGIPYRLVTKKLLLRRSIPGRLEEIVHALFPTVSVVTVTPKAAMPRGGMRESFSIQEITSAARFLPYGKAPGPDNIPNEVLRAAVMSKPQIFKVVFDKCIEESVFPTRWKEAFLVLIPKPGRPLERPTSYRSLCMLDTTSKLFEKSIVRRLRELLVGEYALTDNQYGFRERRSTIHDITRLKEIVRNVNVRGFAYNKWVGMLTLDDKNAFNTTPWPQDHRSSSQ